MHRPVQVAAPADTPVSLAEAKAQLRVEHSADDDLITRLIEAATAHLDGWSGVLGRCLYTQSWRQDFDRFSACLRLPLAPVATVTSVKYDDVDDVEQTVSASNYSLLADDAGPYVRFKSDFAFPSVDSEGPTVRVSYVAGYGDATAIPEAIRHAILMMVGHWYESREAVVVGPQVASLPLAVDALIAPYRRISF